MDYFGLRFWYCVVSWTVSLFLLVVFNQHLFIQNPYFLYQAASGRWSALFMILQFWWAIEPTILMSNWARRCQSLPQLFTLSPTKELWKWGNDCSQLKQLGGHGRLCYWRLLVLPDKPHPSWPRVDLINPGVISSLYMIETLHNVALFHIFEFLLLCCQSCFPKSTLLFISWHWPLFGTTGGAGWGLRLGLLYVRALKAWDCWFI